MKQRRGLGGDPNTTICYFHKTGGCSKPSCRYQHPEPPRDQNGQLIACRHDGPKNTCGDDCKFGHPVRDKDVPDLRDLLVEQSRSASDNKDNRTVSYKTPDFQNTPTRNTLHFGSPRNFVASSTPEKSVLGQNRNSAPVSLDSLPSPSPVFRSAHKRRFQSEEGGSRYKMSKSQNENNPEFQEGSYYQVSKTDIVKVHAVCDSYVQVSDQFDEIQDLRPESLKGEVRKACPFISCKDLEFNTEKPLMEHLILKHFYKNFSDYLNQFYSKADERFKCPKENCAKTFSHMKDAALHYGGFPHAKVIGLLFTSNDLCMSHKKNELEILKETEIMKNNFEAQLKDRNELLNLERKKVELLNSNLKENEEREKRLTKELTEAKQEKDKQLKNSHTQMNGLRKKNTELELVVKNLKNSHLEELRKKDEMIEMEKSKAHQRIKDLEEQLKQEKQVNMELKENVKRLEDLKDTHVQESKKMSDLIGGIQTERITLETSLMNFKEREESLTQAVREVKEEKEKLLRVSEEKNWELKKTEESLNKANIKIRDLEEKEERDRHEIKRLEAFNVGTKNEMHKKNLDYNRQLVNANKTIKEKSNALIVSKKEVELLRKIISDTTQKQEQVKSDQNYKEKFENLQADYSNLVSDIEVLEKEKEGMQEELAQKSVEVDTLKVQKKEVETDLCNMEKERDQFDEDKTELEKRLKEAEVGRKEKLQSVMKQRDEMQRQYEASSHAVRDLRAELRARDEKITGMETRILPFVNKYYGGQQEKQ